jgi:hypothetical protein
MEMRLLFDFARDVTIETSDIATLTMRGTFAKSAGQFEQ